MYAEQETSRSVKVTEFSHAHMRQFDNWHVLRTVEGVQIFSQIRFWWPDYVFVDGSYMDDEAIRVTPLDEDGNCLVRIDLKPEMTLYNDMAAWQIQECLDADERLLSYAL